MATCGQWTGGALCGAAPVRRFLIGYRCDDHAYRPPTPAPELTLEGHAGAVAADTAPARHYGPDQAGGFCEACGTPLPAALAGVLEHPTCDPDWPSWRAASVRAEKRAKKPLPNRT